MKLYLIFLLLSSQVFARESASDHGSYVLRQRAIMLSQLEYEKNLDLLFIDPSTCLRVKNADLVRVLNTNIKALEDNGRLAHCKDMKFIGVRKITKDLEEQKKAVLQIQELEELDTTGIQTSENELKSLAKQTTVSEIIEASDNTIPEKEEKAPTGSYPFKGGQEILAGYVGVPYYSFSEDETFNLGFHEKDDGCCGYSYLFSKLPEGITSGTTSEGTLVGIPKKSGIFTPEISFFEISIAGWILKYRGNLPKMKIFPTPKHTVLNPLMRGAKMTRNNNGNNRPKFYASPYPQLRFEGYARALNSISRGKYYFEVKLDQLGSQSNGNGFEINFAESNKYSQFEEFGLNPGHQGNNRVGNNYYNMSYGMTLGIIPWKKGDLVMVAIDMDAKKIWYGRNGKWIQTENESVGTPAMGIKAHATMPSHVNKVWPSFEPKIGTIFTVNFGDQPFHFDPPQGFKGIPYDQSELDPLPNSWDASSMSAESASLSGWTSKTKVISTFNHMAFGITASSNQGNMYIASHRGDAVSAIEKKKSGRWQFEVELGAYWTSSLSIGLAPDSYETRSHARLEENIQSIGLKISGYQLYWFSDGKLQPLDGNFIFDSGDFGHDAVKNNNTRFTFDCDFDQEKIVVYANGKIIRDGKLPKIGSNWKITTNFNGGGLKLYSFLEEQKFPVAGVLPWNIKASDAKSAGGTNEIISSDLPKSSGETTCSAQSFSTTYHPYDAPTETKTISCELRETPIGGKTSCKTEKYRTQEHQCISTNTGDYACVPYTTYYRTKGECEADCVRTYEFKKECTKDGWK